MADLNLNLTDVKMLLGEKDVIILSLQNKMKEVLAENEALKAELESRSNIREIRKRPEPEDQIVNSHV